VMVGTMNATAVLSEPSDVAIYTELFDELTAAARFGEEGREVLSRIAEAYRRSDAAERGGAGYDAGLRDSNNRPPEH